MNLTNLTIWMCPGCSSQIVDVRSAYGLFCGCAFREGWREGWKP